MRIVPGDVSITANQVLRTLDGLSNIYGIQDRLVVKDNTGLEDACGILHLLEGHRLDYRAPSLGTSGSEIENNGNIYTSKIAVIESCNKILNGDITLTSQAEVDAFDYNIVKGRLTIAESVSGNITNVDALRILKKVGSLHIINNRLLENLSGFNNLRKITDTNGDILVLDTNNGLPNDGIDIINYFFCLRIIGGNPIPGPGGQFIVVPYETIGGEEVVKIRSNLSDPFTSITQISPEYPCEPIRPKNVFVQRDGKSYNHTDENIITEKLPIQIKSIEKIILYPTISKGYQINISGLKTDFAYSIYSTTGQLIEQNKILNSSQNTIIRFKEQLESGMYFIKIQEEGRINTLRFMVK
ncbi:T9SS type A sorting domain-containing protein [Aquimarina sp. RZ0]|uniref:T9SS type A sorting domain-containing protein n=1 Tax=Aquimarina sp. RZ0 TaxID=2607730 RepID=UPI0011F2A79B|nr:T9SS type A sorting domain-containing protein [Aquimarina sp. RZ0]KAA1245443.1 T9SS type A sorting domain-containing protein [Aquimarina sp. RZ0]